MERAGLFTVYSLGRVGAGHTAAPPVARSADSELVRAVTRQSRSLRCGNLELLPSTSQLLLDGRPLDLTSREVELLLALAERRNRVVPRSELYELVWQRRMAYRDRSVDVFVRKLRLKLLAA